MTTNDLGPVDTGQAARILGIGRPILERWRALGIGARYTRHGRWLHCRPGDPRAHVEDDIGGCPPGATESDRRDGSPGCGATHPAPAGGIHAGSGDRR